MHRLVSPFQRTSDVRTEDVDLKHDFFLAILARVEAVSVGLVFDSRFEYLSAMEPMAMEALSSSMVSASPSMVKKKKYKAKKRDPAEIGVEKKTDDMKDPKWQGGFGMTFERLRLQHNYLVKQERLFGCYLYGRNALADEDYPPKRKFQYLVIYLLRFVESMKFEYVIQELQKKRMRAFIKNRAEFAAICAP